MLEFFFSFAFFYYSERGKYMLFLQHFYTPFWHWFIYTLNRLIYFPFYIITELSSFFKLFPFFLSFSWPESKCVSIFLLRLLLLGQRKISRKKLTTKVAVEKSQKWQMILVLRFSLTTSSFSLWTTKKNIKLGNIFHECNFNTFRQVEIYLDYKKCI